MVAPHSVFGFEVTDDQLDDLAAFKPTTVMLLIHPRRRTGSSAGACWVLAIRNRWFLPGNSPHDRRFLQSIKAKSTALLNKVGGVANFSRPSNWQISLPHPI